MSNNTETVPGAKHRARKRDNAARIGELQMAAQWALGTTVGQVSLLVLVVGALLMSGLIGR